MIAEYNLLDGSLSRKGTPVLQKLSQDWSTEEDPVGGGVFLRSSAPPEAVCFHEQALGELVSVKHVLAQYRFVPFWLKPVITDATAKLPPETLWLLGARSDGQHVFVAALLDGAVRFSLRGSASALSVVAETGDPQANVVSSVSLFVAIGPDPYQLFSDAARSVQKRFDLPHRSARRAPRFLDEFGWCTWDAFYKEVSAEKIADGLATFREGGTPPRFLIIDDGWQSVARARTGEDRLVSLAPNARFGGDLTGVVRLAKQQYGVSTVLVWHALLGYWGGLDEVSLSRYRPHTVARAFGPGILEQDPTWNVRPWGAVVGVPSTDHLADFYQDYHSSLAAQGVDGVKVDNQAMLEAVSAGAGGRVILAKRVREALEQSVTQHFGGRLINCMSSTQEAFYHMRESVVLRTSDDFYPNRPETHPLHVFANAVSGLWLGEFIQPDWDMFQSGHPTGPLHAAARVLSGGPLYVSDKPGIHNFALLRKLTLHDGTHLRCDQPGRPTKDCLFVDPTHQPLAYKIFNRCGTRGLLGAFNLRVERECSVNVAASPADVPGLNGETFAVFGHRSGRLSQRNLDQALRFKLSPGEWEIVTIAPITHSFAAIGLVDKLNSPGAILKESWVSDQNLVIDLKTGGRFVAWCKRSPARVEMSGNALPFEFDPSQHRLTIIAEVAAPVSFSITWV